jgi:endonuclease/exonuclease/phosphatase family metal-dependent hydrolase
MAKNDCPVGLLFKVQVRLSLMTSLSLSVPINPETDTFGGIEQDLKDSKAIAKITFGPLGTFNNFEFDKPVTQRIDFIFVSSEIRVDKYAVLSDSWDLKYPSDHFPVFAELF